MRELKVNRTLGKPPPEVWSEFSEVERLANHLGEFGEISISRLEPEHTVAWEGERASGTVVLEAFGGGTRVTLKAEVHELETSTPPSSLTVHRLIPDLEAWDRSAAEIEAHARMQTAAAQRAAERATERAERERKRARRPFRRRRAESEETTQGPSPIPDPPPLADPPPARQGPENGAGTDGVAEDRARAVLETALDSLDAVEERPPGSG